MVSLQDSSARTNEDDAVSSNPDHSLPECIAHQTDPNINDSSDLSSPNVRENSVPAKKSGVCSIL